MQLADYLCVVSSRPFVRGECDCCIFVADWVLDQTGKDPGDGLRGYSTDRGAMIRIGRAGGLVQLADKCLTSAGLKRVEKARPGDVAIVKLHDRLTCSIRSTNSWCCKEGPGLIFGDFEPVAIWRF